ncbi:MAG TPA: B12-binding domain-containing protein [Pyrinomonadaceae bacterium]|nr:B12-binding domain-containing protein [Pyrinomonadaceae bacterium]
MNRLTGGRRLTSREAARALGVSEASVKRWADSGLLPMEKTAGGHRRFRPEDVAAVRRAGLAAAGAQPPQRKGAEFPAREARAPELDPGREAALAEESFRALLGGDDEELSSLLVSLHLDGQSVGRIADRLLCAPMRRVGDLWHAGELSVAQEHVATRTAVVALQGLRASLQRPAAGDSLRALCCSVEDDFHELPLRLARMTLEACGLAVFDLGVSTPFSALAEAVHRFRPELVCVSSTVLLRLDRAAYEYAVFHRAARRARAAVVLGGAGFREEGVRRRLPADLHAESFLQLEEFAGMLAAVQS